ncbi:MAG: apolipoprotein N-acyltransferase [Arcobacteraceae bacterium]
MFTYKSLITPLLFSFFIYSSFLVIENFFLNTTFAIMGFVSLFMLTKKELFVSGFLIGVLWFWWIGYSFVYYELSFLIPLVIIGIGFIYGVLFYIIGLSTNLFYRVGYIFTLSFIAPFGFNWFKIELPFVNSYFGTSKIEFLIILLCLALFLTFQKKYKKQSISGLLSVFIGLYFYNHFSLQEIRKPQIQISKYETSIDQSKRWDRSHTRKIVLDNISAIEKAIEDKKDLIILPETAFPLVLNHQDELNGTLLSLSNKIAIVTGSLYEKDELYYNSTYFYDQGKVQVAHKVVLVPFGEAVPLPEKLKLIINDIFYNGAKDYETAEKPTTFMIKGIKFRNAICYEATTDEIYQDLDTSYVIAISNNAWFTPSIQPTLQKLLMKYYSQKYNLIFFDVSNT